ncbi:Purine nucleoside phosphorylase [Cymbomonas tetramitiformis]|uniref:polyribonucleotide nucleotidyltransferase n=1 Tax=Cymbomonas tetramitiformis TaxID=36881 RepID=A0AAE0BML5_9CHLO|nr:Purine nucleoside phosphorylase [Cymbomonas tetramitiformis]
MKTSTSNITAIYAKSAGFVRNGQERSRFGRKVGKLVRQGSSTLRDVNTKYMCTSQGLNQTGVFPLTSFFPGNKRFSVGRKATLIRAEAESAPGVLPEPHKVTISVGDGEIHLETGRIGRQANGAVMATEGDTMIYTTACFDEEVTGDGSFTPLTIVYQERLSAVGKTSSGYLKRDGRPKEFEVLTSRLIDRPIRPMIKSGWAHDTQVLSWVLSYDEVRGPEPLAITAAGAALAVSAIPLVKPVAGVRVGWLKDEAGPMVNPTRKQMEDSKLDLIIAGTEDGILMIEGYGDFLSDEEMLLAVDKGHEAVAEICSQLAAWAEAVGKPKTLDSLQTPPEGIDAAFAEVMSEAEMENMLQIRTKQARDEVMKGLKSKVKDELGFIHSADETVEDERVSLDDDSDALADVDAQGGFSEAAISSAFKRAASKTLRRLVVEDGIRSDGRGVGDVRPISSSAGLLPRVHGSSLFTRGETQSISTCTLGGSRAAMNQEDLRGDNQKRFYLQYFFPPSSVGETGRMGGAGRREIGHGQLAERALVPIIPDESEFPYVIRVESTITESNGSSSMASVCAGCIALMDAGVPIKRPVAGVAMGLILEEAGGEVKDVVLTDILGSEDALGDMDFKVAGDAEGITAFQMDIKVEGITLKTMRKALAAAGEGRRHILQEMAKCDPEPRTGLGLYSPRIEKLSVNAKYVRELIGAGGKNIKALVESTGVTSIDITNEGEVTIVGPGPRETEAAQAHIEAVTEEPVKGKVYKNCVVKNVVEFGCFVEILPGKDGLVHVSELAHERIEIVSEHVSPGDIMDVQLIEINNRGQLKLSRKTLLSLPGTKTPEPPTPPTPPSPPATVTSGRGVEWRLKLQAALRPGLPVGSMFCSTLFGSIRLGTN